jgi:uncharacterized membrane protein YuzA (DUF378 family)
MRNKIYTKPIQEVVCMKKLDLLAATLVLVGALNWGLVAIAEFDLVAWVFGEEFGTTNAASRVVYGLVGIAAVYGIASLVASRSALGAGRPATSHH